MLIEFTAGAFVARSLNVTLRSQEKIETAQPLDDLPFLSIVVPARDEERQIEGCVRSLLAQRYPRFEVIVVDDRSTDGTRAILDGIAEEDARLKIVAGADLPPDWIGKPWALQQGGDVARGEWLLFTDADTIHEPLAASSSVQYALAHGTDVLSLLPTQIVKSFAERAVLPSILWMIAFAVGSLDAVNDPSRLDSAILNGQFVLFKRSAYTALGEHTAVAGCIAEDYEFAQIVKRDGRFRLRLVGANDLVYTRMYRSFAEIWQGFEKNLYLAVEDRPVRAALGALVLASLAPLAELLLLQHLRTRRYTRAARMAAAIAATAAAAEFAMRRARFPKGSGAYFPIGIASMLAIFLSSVLRHRTGRVVWRGRRYGRRTTTPGSQT